MIERHKSGISKFFLIAIFILIGEIGVMIYPSVPRTLTGFSVKTTTINIYTSIAPISRIMLIAQWFLIMPLIIFLFIKKSRAKEKKELVGIDIKQIIKNSKTDLDALYTVLKIKKQLRISSISKLFEIEKELATEWARILELGDLATIDYPGIGEPIVILKKKKLKPKEKKKLNFKKNIKDKKLEKKGKQPRFKKQIKKLAKEHKRVEKNISKAIKKENKEM